MKSYSEICINGKVIRIDKTRSNKIKSDLEQTVRKNEHLVNKKPKLIKEKII